MVAKLADTSADGYLISGLIPGGADDKRSHYASGTLATSCAPTVSPTRPREIGGDHQTYEGESKVRGLREVARRNCHNVSLGDLLGEAHG
jgi:hypothetical protein